MFCVSCVQFLQPPLVHRPSICAVHSRNAQRSEAVHESPDDGSASTSRTASSSILNLPKSTVPPAVPLLMPGVPCANRMFGFILVCGARKNARRSSAARVR